MFIDVREPKAAGAAPCTGFSAITASTSKFQRSTPALVHGRRAVTFHSGVDAAVWVAASASCSPLSTLCFRKFSRGLGSVERLTWPNLCPDLRACFYTPPGSRCSFFFFLLFFLPPTPRHVGCLSGLKCPPLTCSDGFDDGGRWLKLS